MSLIACADCGAKMSSNAKACPACGAPAKKKTTVFTWIIGGFFALIVGAWVLGSNTAPPAPAPAALTPEQLAAKAAKEREFQTVLAGARFIQQTMNNPKSFELVSASLIDHKTACYEFRGTNSFNAVILNRRVIGEKINSDEASAWNKHCAGKSGTDYSYVRAAF